MVDKMSRISTLLCLFFAGLLGAQSPPAKKPAPKPPLATTPPTLAGPKTDGAITSLKIEGNVVEPIAAILQVAAIKAGDMGSKAIFDAARDRLMSTGYFDNVRYSYRQT